MAYYNKAKLSLTFYKTEEGQSEDWFKQLCEKVDDAIYEAIDAIDVFVCANIALITIDGLTEYEVDHSEDPYYDYSGKLRKTRYIEVSEYADIGFREFMEMYTGETEPTFESGCGMRHGKFDEEIERWILNAAREIQLNTIREEVLKVCAIEGKELEETVEYLVWDMDYDTIANEGQTILENLPAYENNWTLKGIWDKGIFIAHQIDANRQEYASEKNAASRSLAKKAQMIALPKDMPPLENPDNLSYHFGAPVPYITKNDRLFLRWLRKNYSPEEIELLIISGKIIVSNSLNDEYCSLRTDEKYNPKPQKPQNIDFSLVYNKSKGDS